MHVWQRTLSHPPACREWNACSVRAGPHYAPPPSEVREAACDAATAAARARRERSERPWADALQVPRRERADIVLCSLYALCTLPLLRHPCPHRALSGAVSGLRRTPTLPPPACAQPIVHPAHQAASPGCWMAWVRMFLSEAPSLAARSLCRVTGVESAAVQWPWSLVASWSRPT